MTEKQYEKITVNLPAVDLGKIDYLVEQGFYNTRTEFIRTAIKNEIDKNKFAIDSVIQEEGKKDGSAFVVGVYDIKRQFLEKYLQQKRKVSVFVIGMCIIDKSVDVGLAKNTISSFKVYGIKKGPKEVLEFLTKKD
jgi:metal-responsive CopG/Arc/MetJ family transcriptional regulator